MDFEKYINRKESYTVNVAGGEPDSLRKIVTTLTSVRAYDGRHIGVSGGMGNVDVKKLEKEAENNLGRGIPYPSNLFDDKQSVDETKVIVHPEDFVDVCRSLTSRIARELPECLAGNKISLNYVSTDYTNSKGAALHYAGNNMTVALSFKDKKSASIMDFFYGATGNTYSEDNAVSDCVTLGKAFINKVDLPEEPLKVAFDSGTVTMMLINDMIAETYNMGAGKLAGKLGQKLFSDALTIAVKRGFDRRVSETFFDAEGVVDRNFKLVSRGEFKGLLTNKRSAAMFTMPLSASAATQNFDSVPSYGGEGLCVMPTAAKITDIASDFIYVATTSGGDVAPDGTVGLPIQLAYLVRAGKLVGRLPEMNLTANIFDLLGSLYCGTASNNLLKGPVGFIDIFDARVRL